MSETASGTQISLNSVPGNTPKSQTTESGTAKMEYGLHPAEVIRGNKTPIVQLSLAARHKNAGNPIDPERLINEEPELK